MEEYGHLTREELWILEGVAAQAQRSQERRAALHLIVLKMESFSQSECSLLESAIKFELLSYTMGFRKLELFKIKKTEESSQRVYAAVHSKVMSDITNKFEWALKLTNILLDIHQDDCESMVFFYKLKGDIIKWFTYANLTDPEDLIETGKIAYETGFSLSRKLAPGNNLASTIALHYTLYCYENLHDYGLGIKIAQNELEILKEWIANHNQDHENQGGEELETAIRLSTVLRNTITLGQTENN